MTKRTQLLETAERLFYEEGFHATGIDRIVADAGVVRMTLYNHFPSKEALTAEVLQRRHERFLARLDRAVEASTVGGSTWALVEAHCEWLAEQGHHGCIMVKAMGEFAEHSARVYERALAAKTDLLGRIRAALARDGMAEPTGLANRVFLGLEGSNAAVPVLGLDAALTQTRELVTAVLAHPEGGQA